MLIELRDNHKIMNVILPVIICYFIYNALVFVNFPANCFIPRNSIKAKELFDTAGNYLKEGKSGKASEVYDYIEKHYSEYIVDVNTL